jgi:hypothetical protein
MKMLIKRGFLEAGVSPVAAALSFGNLTVAHGRVPANARPGIGASFD